MNNPTNPYITSKTEKEWIDFINDIEPSIFTANDWFNCNGINKDRIRVHHAILDGESIFISLDYEKIEWVAIYIVGYNKLIKNPESSYEY